MVVFFITFKIENYLGEKEKKFLIVIRNNFENNLY